jgi:hypothetical protein
VIILLSYRKNIECLKRRKTEGFKEEDALIIHPSQSRLRAKVDVQIYA